MTDKIINNNNGSHSKNKQNLNNSQSIENERNRIYDVVNSSAFGGGHNGIGNVINAASAANGNSQNALFKASESSGGSPMFRKNNENGGPFGGSKIFKNSVVRN